MAKLKEAQSREQHELVRCLGQALFLVTPWVTEWEEFVKVNVVPVEHLLRKGFGEGGQACSDISLLCRFLLQEVLHKYGGPCILKGGVRGGGV